MRIVYLFIFIAIGCRPSNQIGELVGMPSHRPLEGTVWVLEELNGKVIGAVEGQKSPFVFYHSESNAARGFAGCNSFTGTFTKDGSVVSAKLASTRMFCEGKMDLESEFMNVLGASYKILIEENHLFLKNKGTVVAEFHAEVKTSY